MNLKKKKTLKKDEENDSKAPPHELTEEEKQQILHSEEFLSFFDHSTRIVERALSEQINIFFDYSGRDLEDKEGEIQAGAKLSLNRQFLTNVGRSIGLLVVWIGHLSIRSYLWLPIITMKMPLMSLMVWPLYGI